MKISKVVVIGSGTMGSGIAATLGEALEASYQIIGGIELEGSHYREDIGFRALP